MYIIGPNRPWISPTWTVPAPVMDRPERLPVHIPWPTRLPPRPRGWPERRPWNPATDPREVHLDIEIQADESQGRLLQIVLECQVPGATRGWEPVSNGGGVVLSGDEHTVPGAMFRWRITATEPVTLEAEPVPHWRVA